MSWGLTYTGYLNRVRKDDVQAAITECEEMLRFYENRLLTMSATNAMYFPDSGGGENILWCEHVAIEIPNVVEGITETAGKLAILHQVLMSDNVEED